jgi:hypothetical protein
MPEIAAVSEASSDVVSLSVWRRVNTDRSKLVVAEVGTCLNRFDLQGGFLCEVAEAENLVKSLAEAPRSLLGVNDEAP